MPILHFFIAVCFCDRFCADVLNDVTGWHIFFMRIALKRDEAEAIETTVSSRIMSSFHFLLFFLEDNFLLK